MVHIVNESDLNCVYILVVVPFIFHIFVDNALNFKRFSDDLFVPRSDSFLMNPEKKTHSFLIFTMFPTRTLPKTDKRY